MIVIKELYSAYVENLVCEVDDAYQDVKELDALNSVCVIAKYEEAKEIIRNLVMIGYGIAEIDDLADVDCDNYDDEYEIVLLKDEIYCEPLKRKNGYLYVEDNITFLLDNCSSKVIPFIKSPVAYEVHLCGDCEGCDGCDDEEKDEDDELDADSLVLLAFAKFLEDIELLEK